VPATRASIIVAGLAAALIVATTAGPAAALRPDAHLDSTSIATSESVTIQYGASTALTTTLTDTTTSSPVAGADVSLLEKSNGPGYTTIATPTTDADGVAKATVSPKALSYYKWSYDGDGSHHRAMSTASTVSVSQVVHAALSKKRVKRHRATKVYGTVKPHGEGKTVTLEKLVAGKWRQLPITARLEVQKLPNGKTKAGFVMPFTPKHKGKVKLRVESDPTRQNPGGVSKRLKLKVT
jgi:5-hydroxyisourate hydrolase-like protein (transthyretin family)